MPFYYNWYVLAAIAVVFVLLFVLVCVVLCLTGRRGKRSTANSLQLDDGVTYEMRNAKRPLKAKVVHSFKVQIQSHLLSSR